MRILAVGDVFIRPESLVSACQAMSEFEPEVESVFWGPPDQPAQQKNNLLVELNGPEALPVPAEVVCRLGDIETLLVHRCPVSEAMLKSAPKLRIVGVCRGGHENIDVEAATRLGIRAFHVIGRNAEAVSDFTIGLLLGECRNIARSHHAILQRRWVKSYANAAYVPELKGKTIGLVGFGQIGQRVVRKLQGFGVHVLVHDPFVSDDAIRSHGAQATDIKTLFRLSDFVSLHARLQEGTEKLVNRELLQLMKPTAYFINTARAGLVDEHALLEALREHRIAGAALDVFWEEPLRLNSPWLQLDNVTLSSHLAGTTFEAFANTPRLLAEQIAVYLRTGEAPGLLNPLNPALQNRE